MRSTRLLLEGLMPSPVVRLNRAVAVAMAGDIAAGLAIVDELSRAAQPPPQEP